MIWAIQPFKDELDVLEIKLATLYDAVDRFVITEATVTQTGYPKPLVFRENKDRFEPWMDKIAHVVVEDMPPGRGFEADWRREKWQRDSSLRAMGDFDDRDLILSSDCDEIPFPEQINEEYLGGGRMILAQHVYALNWRWRGEAGARSQLIRGKHLRRFDPSEWVSLATSRCSFDPEVEWPTKTFLPSEWHELEDVMPHNRGWHFSYMGGVESIRSKILSIADDFRDSDHAFALDRDHIARCISHGQDLYGRENPAEWVPITELPPYVQYNPGKFAHMMVPPVSFGDSFAPFTFRDDGMPMDFHGRERPDVRLEMTG